MFTLCAINLATTMSCDGGVNIPNFGNGGFAGDGGKYKYRPKLNVKVTKNDQGGEKWVMVIDNVHTKESIKQPDPERQALSGSATAGIDGDVTYTYGDELPKKIIQATLCTVMCTILATPLTLFCMIPMILKLRKVCPIMANITYMLLLVLCTFSMYFSATYDSKSWILAT